MKRRSFLKCLAFLPVMSSLNTATADEYQENVHPQSDESDNQSANKKQYWVKTADGLVYRMPAEPRTWSLKVLVKGETTPVRKIG